MSHNPSAPLWVFGYGSLMWQPDFPVAEAKVARALGWRRSFCMWSIHHRGSAEAPGLVLALEDHAASHCDGLALRVTPGREADTLAMLRERELVSSAYLEVTFPVSFLEGGGTEVLGYVMDRAHSQYTGVLDLEEQAQIILRSSGGRGLNRDYLWSTVTHLETLGIQDDELEWLAARVRDLAQ